jgi:hypothetical protein
MTKNNLESNIEMPASNFSTILILYVDICDIFPSWSTNVIAGSEG